MILDLTVLSQNTSSSTESSEKQASPIKDLQYSYRQNQKRAQAKSISFVDFSRRLIKRKKCHDQWYIINSHLYEAIILLILFLMSI